MLCCRDLLICQAVLQSPSNLPGCSPEPVSQCRRGLDAKAATEAAGSGVKELARKAADSAHREETRQGSPVRKQTAVRSLGLTSPTVCSGDTRGDYAMGELTPAAGR